MAEITSFWPLLSHVFSFGCLEDSGNWMFLALGNVESGFSCFNCSSELLVQLPGDLVL